METLREEVFEEAPKITRDEALAQSTALVEEAYCKIDEADYDDAIGLAGYALEKITSNCGELAFESCKFYYVLADTLLCKIETSTEILNDIGTSNAINTPKPTSQEILTNVEEVLSNSKEMVREMFQQMGNSSAVPTSLPVSESQISSAAPISSQDDPIIKNEDSEEEEIITTKKVKFEETKEEEHRRNPYQNLENGQATIPEEQNEEDYWNDQFKAPWENLEVAITIFEKTKTSQENPEEFEQLNWNLKADILERQADLEVARENTKEGIELYQQLIEFSVKHNWNREKSRSIAGILFKIGCAYSLLKEGFQAALDHFHEAADVLTFLFIEEIQLWDPDVGDGLTVTELKNKENLEKVEVWTDKASELKSILIEIHNKIEECTLSIEENPILEKERKEQEAPNTFKKPMFEDKASLNLGSFGKGKKRDHNQMQQIPAEPNKEETENIKPEEVDRTKESETATQSEDEPSKKQSPDCHSIENQAHKRQKIEED